MGKRRLLIVAAAALFDGEGRVLLAQRPEGKALAGLWEFPGGKLEAGESPEEGLARELLEELGVVVAPGDFTPVGFSSAPLADGHLLMPLWAATRWTGEPRGLEGQALAWVAPDDLDARAMPPADGPLCDLLRARARGRHPS
jgi:8-oxo-dGTP diphosphatase